MSKLPKEFYTRPDVVQISKELLGKRLVTCINGQITSGIITETEAYEGATDKASHAYKNRRTKRTEVMFAEGGIAYVYLCYGIHHLFNIVTNQEDIPHAILVRAIAPEQGLDIMKERRKKEKINKTFSGGPGTVSQALGIRTNMTGLSLLDEQVWVEETGITIPEEKIYKGPRIGIDYAEEDALLPYRFVVEAGLLRSSFSKK